MILIKNVKLKKEKTQQALARQLRWLGRRPTMPRLQVRSPVRAHTRINQIDVSHFPNSFLLIKVNFFLKPNYNFSNVLSQSEVYY